MEGEEKKEMRKGEKEGERSREEGGERNEKRKGLEARLKCQSACLASPRLGSNYLRRRKVPGAGGSHL
jgi:hypothetical protein